MYIRAAISLLICLLMIPSLAYSDCWELIPRTGDTIITRSIWGLHDRLGGGSAILGKIDNKDVTLPVDSIQSIEFDKPEIGAQKNSHAQGIIRLTSGKSGQFTSSYPIQYIRDTGQDEIFPGALQSVKRCSQIQSEQPFPGNVTNKQGIVPVATPVADKSDQIIMKNGDILLGSIVTTVFRWKSEYDLMKIPGATIRSIESQDGEKKSAVLYLRNGGRIAGNLGNSKVKMKLTFGQDITVSVDKVRIIRFKKQ